MKTINFKLTFFAALFLTIAGSLTAASVSDYSRKVHKAFPKSSVSTLVVSNKFGEIKINDLGGDSVTIDVRITTDDYSSRAENLVRSIKITIEKSGNTINAETVFPQDFRTKGKFTVDYTINIPADRNLNITNKFGNVVLKDLNAKGAFNISYGNLTGSNLKAPSGEPITLDLAYGKADIQSINLSTMSIRYSKIFLGSSKKLTVESRYCGLNMTSIDDILLDSRYDAVSIDQTESLKADSKYTNYKIGQLNKRLEMNTDYGSVRVANVNPQFEKIVIDNSYGGISLGVGENANYKLNADCDYCGVEYPSSRFVGNRIKDNQHISLSGTVGNGGGLIVITSKYGSIKLIE
jgi:hypothetical protein